MQDVKGKTAIVTGASRGIGRTIAEQLAGLGIKVAVNYASSPEKAKEVVEGIREKGGEAVAVQADLSTVAAGEIVIYQNSRGFRQSGHPDQQCRSEHLQTDSRRHRRRL